jgi:CRISPR-associated protein Csc1
MLVSRCRLTLQDSVYFATREMGTLYETERFLHNYALSYALFNDSVLQVPYFWAGYRPHYADDLGKLNERGIYVTPARPLMWDYVLLTWKMGQVNYFRKVEKFGGRNYPANIGRSKELAPESVFEFFVLHGEPLDLPRWIRLGKWASKALVEVTETKEAKLGTGAFVSACTLNPLDVPLELKVYDVISMPPVSLVDRAYLEGEHYVFDETTRIPANMRYNVPA